MHQWKRKLILLLKSDSTYISTSNILLPTTQNSVSDFALEYLLDFKESMNLTLGEGQLNLEGQIDGKMESSNDSLTVSLNSKIDYLKYLNNKDVLFLVNANLKCVLANHLIDGYSGNVFADVKFDAERLYAGGNIYNIKSSFILEENDLIFSFDGQYEQDIFATLKATALFDQEKLKINVDSLNLNYNKFIIKNAHDLKFTYADETVNFDEFELKIGDGSLTAVGAFGVAGDNELVITLDSLSGNRIIKDIRGQLGDKEFDAKINMIANIHGNFSDPKFSVTASAINIKYGDGNFGSLVSVFNYENNSLVTDVKFIDSTGNYDTPSMLISGFIPLNLTSIKDSVDISDKGIELTIESDEFDLSALKNILPYVQFQEGKLETDIYITGTVAKPIAMGYFSINDARLKITQNNLDYNLNAKIWIDDEEITFETITLQNVFGTKQGGTLKGEGFVKLNEFKLDSTLIKVNGDLKVLDKISKSSSPLVYGDVAILTRGDIVYSAKGSDSYLNLPIAITVADIVVPLSKSAYSSNSGFIYKYPEGTEEVDRLIRELDSLIRTTDKIDSLENINEKSFKFDYTVDIELDTEAEVVVILSKELDQNLVAILDGNFFLESINGVSKSGGELRLLEGSSLSFIKTFSTTGTVKFDKLDNPIIDITSTYRDYYYPPNSTNGQTEQEVAVKIKLKGPLSELNQNFIKDENNIGVYMGRQAIDEDKKDQSKNATDAMYFLIIGKFPGDDNNQNDKNLVASTTTALAGSLIGEVLNQYFDNYVTGFQLRQTSTDTKFNLMGKVWKIKYEIGGSTEVLQDLSRANVKMEYPITERLQLRVERKESENQTTSSINNPLFFEGGFKYNFEF